MSTWYRLDAQHRPVPVASPIDPSYRAWWDNAANRLVARTTCGDATVITVFMGWGPQYGGGPPLLFGTLISAPAWMRLEGEKVYATWEDALAGHTRWVARVQEEAEGEKGAAMDELDKALESLGESLDAFGGAQRAAELFALEMVFADAARVVAVYRQGKIARKDDVPHA